jgi:hypothetical protein
LLFRRVVALEKDHSLWSPAFIQGEIAKFQQHVSKQKNKKAGVLEIRRTKLVTSKELGANL